MKTPSEYKNQLTAFIKHLHQADETSRSAIHWWWFKRLVDFLYRPCQIVAYIFTYIPPFSWIYHAFEGIFGKNGYIGVGSVAGLYIAIYGVAQSSNQDELDRQERAIEKYEAAMKLDNPREKMHGMRGLVTLSAQPIQLKPVFRCPIQFGDCESYWFELSQYRLDVMSEELGHFYGQCHKNQDCRQSTVAAQSEQFQLDYLTEDKDFITYNDFDDLKIYLTNPDNQFTYSTNSISYHIYRTITPLLNLKNLHFKGLDVSRWPLFRSQLRETQFQNTHGELLDMRTSVYRRIHFNKVNFVNYLADGSLIYNSQFNDSTIQFAVLRKGVSLHNNQIQNSQLRFDSMPKASFVGSKLVNTSITMSNLSTCSASKYLIQTPKSDQQNGQKNDQQSIDITDILQLHQQNDSLGASAIYQSRLRCQMILPNSSQCRFISKNQCLNEQYQVISTENMTITTRR